jgi:hypothetical protein
MAATFQTQANTAAPAGRAPVLPAAQQARINHEPIPAWWYRAHPSRWMCVDGEWLPQLAKFSSKPGQSNVKNDGDTSLAETLARKEGWTIIPWDCIEGGYLRVFDGTQGAVHLSRWETPRQVGTQLVILSDDEGYRAFLRHLMEAGYVAPPDPVVLDVLMERQAARISTNENRQHEPLARARYERDVALLEEMRSATAKASEASSAPTRRRRG